MKKVFVKGYCFNNLGDDLFIKMLARRYPNIQFILICNPQYAKAFYNEENIRVIRFFMPIRVVDKFMRNFFQQLSITQLIERFTELTITIAGSVFQEITGDIDRRKRTQKIVSNSDHYYILGVNFGPYITTSYLEAARSYFFSAEDVCFRDTYSYELFKENDKVRYAPDIL